MLKFNYEQIVDKIIKEKGISKEEIDGKVNEKVKQLSDLISKEGAAHIIANQLGVKLFDETFRKKWEIKDVIAGMNNVTVVKQL